MTWPIVQVHSTSKMKLHCYDQFKKVRFMKKLDRTTMLLIVQVWSMSKSELNYHDWSDKLRSITKYRDENDVTFIKVWSPQNTILNYQDWIDSIRSMMKTSQDNDVINLTSPLYAENETQLLWLIQWDIVYDEDQIGQQHDWSYRCSLHRKWNWIAMTNQTRCSLSWKAYKTTIWSIV